MPSNPLKPSKVKAKRQAWHGQRPGRHPTRFSGIESARSQEGTNATSYEFNSDRSADGINPVQELTGSTPKANLLTGLGVDETFSRTDASGPRHLLTDALGSTLALTDGTGAVQTRYSYEPYGKTTVSGTASSNSFEDTGRENDNTGLYFYRARYYNPGLQRFVSEDPIGLAGGPNVYGYVGGNPISRIDPSGLAGVGLIGSASVEGGLVGVGAGATGSLGGGVFWGGESGVNAGGFASAGAFAGGPGYGAQYPNYPQGNNSNVAGGAFAGVGGGAFVTNAMCAAELRGPFDTYSFNIGVGPIKVSVQVGVSGETWIGSATFGPGGGISGSSYPTNTWATGR